MPEDEVINLLFDYIGPSDLGEPVFKAFRERNEEKTAMISVIPLPVKVWERLGRPDSINVQITRVL